MVRDQYANYVVQTALNVVEEGEEKRLLLEELTARLSQLVRTGKCSHIHKCSEAWSLVLDSWFRPDDEFGRSVWLTLLLGVYFFFLLARSWTIAKLHIR